MSKRKYLFIFKQSYTFDVFNIQTISHRIIAETHLDAFKSWCGKESIQNLSMSQLGKLTIEVIEASDDIERKQS